MLFKGIALLLVSLFLTNSSFASESIRSALQEYQYAVTVEWDQKDPEFLKAQEDILLKSVEGLLHEGQSPQSLMQESLTLLPDNAQRKEIEYTISLYENGSITNDELIRLLQENSSHMTSGAAWSTLAKVAVGAVVGYAVLKCAVLIFYYWDTDPNYGTPEGDNPPKT